MLQSSLVDESDWRENGASFEKDTSDDESTTCEDGNESCEKGTSEDEPQGAIIGHMRGGLLVFAWALTLTMLLLFQIVSYRQAAAGELSFAWQIILAGIIGIVFSSAAVLLLAVPTWIRLRIATLAVGALFGMCFILLMRLPVTQESFLRRVDTILSVRCTCAFGKIVDVSELLTFSVDPLPALNATIVTSFNRGLFYNFEPSEFVAEGFDPIQNVQITHVSDEVPLKQVSIGFDKLVVLKGEAAKEYSLRLNYTARLGPTEGDCNAAQCGVWQVTGAYNTTVATTLSVRCSTESSGICGADFSGDAAVTSNCGAAIQEPHGKYKIVLDVPGLHIGTNICPFAWKRSWHRAMWLTGACFLACACCCVPFGVQQCGSARLRCAKYLWLLGFACLAVGSTTCIIAFVLDITTLRS